MRCSRCQHEPPAGADFCPECGARLALLCPRCGAAAEASHKFCVKCGASLAVSPPASPAAPTAAAERRQLTVMFCDVVGATAVSATLDPEETRELIGAYQQTCAAAIARFDGHVAQYLGDGLLVYFGYPLAHEDDARRAVRAALEIVDAVQRAGLRPHRDAERLAVRVGIHTGLVVVGQVGDRERHEQLALGETPNLAARLQALATPDTVVVSEATYRLAGPGFRWKDLGTLTIRGFAQPQRVWQPLSQIGGARRAPTDVPLVGRDTELSLLARRWTQAQRGDGQVVLLTGEPGIGKSRIAETFVDDTGAGTVLRWFCSPYHQNSALHPFAAQVEHACGAGPEDAAARRLDALERWVDATGAPRDRVPLLAALLSIPFADRYGALDMTPPAQREKTLQALEEQVVRLATSQPVLGVLEDAHWIDPTSRTLLDRLVDLVLRHRALLLVTARPEFAAPWTRLPHVTVLTLNHLGREEASHLVGAIARGRALSAALIAGIVERGEGIPLYVEEITKAALEGDEQIPATLRDSLTARLDRLGPAKEVAQAAAVIGREFDEDVLAAITGFPDERRRDGLAQLHRAQLVVERRGTSGTIHVFRHALLQEAAYQSLLHATRRHYHRRIAEALESRFADRTDSEPETVAHHFTEAGDAVRAATYWLRAGQRAAQRSANLEAVEHLRKGQQLLERCEPGAERDELELALLIALGPALMATRGWNAREVDTSYARARALAAERGRSTDVFPALWGRWLVAHSGGQAERARELLAELTVVLKGATDVRLLMQLDHATVSTKCSDADLAGSAAHVEEVVRRYRVEEHREQALVYGGHDPGVCVLSIGALVHLMRGDLRRSRRLSDDALALAARVGHVPSVAHADWYRAELAHIHGDVAEAQARAHTVLGVASEKGIPHYAAWARLVLGWAMVQRGVVDAGLALLDEGLVALHATGNHYHLAHRFTVRTDALAAAGRVEAARESAEEAVEAAARTGEVWYEPEVLRVKARLLQAGPAADPTLAERCLEQALHSARAHGAKFWELRTAATLASLRAAQGRGDGARDVLRTALAGFGDARDVPEIAAAFALLTSL